PSILGHVLPTFRIDDQLLAATNHEFQKCVLEMRLWATTDKPAKWKIRVRTDSVGDHLKDFELSILSLALVKAIQDDGDRFKGVLALEGGKWFNNELSKLNRWRFL